MFVYKITEMTVMGGGSIKGEGRIQDMGGVPAEPRREMRRSVGVGREVSGWRRMPAIFTIHITPHLLSYYTGPRNKL